MAVLASVLGRTVEVSPKASWPEPLVFWFADIRPSGSGKTPAARMLCRVLYREQAKTDKAYQAEMDEWRALKPKERGPEPARARSYFATSPTLEALRFEAGGHGGLVIIQDELSAFLTGQGQYKEGKGNDREAWICLHDGNPARVVRVSGSTSISGMRVQVFGGVQPVVWKKVFGSKDGLFLTDGTVYRFLPTFEGESYCPLTLVCGE